MNNSYANMEININFSIINMKDKKMNIKICVSGKTAAGKTTISFALSQRFDFQVVSFGNILRDYFKTLNIKPTKEILHQKSEKIVASVGNYGAMDWFIKHSPQIDWNNNLIVEGCRHPETYQRMQELYNSCLLVHCSCCESVQIKRLIERDKMSVEQIRKITAHPVEKDLDTEFVQMADIINDEHTKQNVVINKLELLLRNNDTMTKTKNLLMT